MLGRAALVLSLTILLTITVPVTTHGTPIVNPVNGHAYTFVSSPMVWREAEANAVGMGGHLVSIVNQAEQDFVVANFVPMAIAAGNPYGRFWLGLTDEASEGNFVWTSGEPLTYTNWLPGEPSNSRGREHYVEIRETNGKWNDLENDPNWLRFSVVEIVPEPASFCLLVVGSLLVSWRRNRSN